MIDFNYETEFELADEALYQEWISKVIASEGKKEGEISYIFCDDEYLLELNQQHLDHDTLTDIISFDYTLGNEISGDIFISIERVMDNAMDYNVPFEEELKRVMCHGVLHYCGYKDKENDDKKLMRAKEEEKMKLYN